MKTIEEFYKEIAASKELQEELNSLNLLDATLEAFLKKHECNATAKDFLAFVRAQNEGEIEDDDAAKVDGGTRFFIVDEHLLKIEVKELP